MKRNSRLRSTEAEAWQHLYKTARWQKLRAVQLAAYPLCRMCLEDGRLTPASVADHVKAHKGNEELFFDLRNLASLCAPHHNSVKQSEERRGQAIKPRGADGWPLD